MFRSKSFTIAFVLMSIVIVGLGGVLCYLLFGEGLEALDPAAQAQNQPIATVPVETAASLETAPSSEETAASETTAETTADATLTPENSGTARALTIDEKHNYPVLGEVIPCTGTLTITQSGDNGEGLIFHKYPQFDAPESPGNQTIYSGTFRIKGKVYVMDNGRPCLMYQTEDDLYVTSSAVYVAFEPDNAPVYPIDPMRVISYGYGQSKGYVATIYHDDGDTAVFSLMNYNADTGETSPILMNVIGTYDSEGKLSFEFMNYNGKKVKGSYTFDVADDDAYTSKIIRFRFGKEIPTDKGGKKKISLRN